jgi:hypothetical protein
MLLKKEITGVGICEGGYSHFNGNIHMTGFDIKITLSPVSPFAKERRLVFRRNKALIWYFAFGNLSADHPFMYAEKDIQCCNIV